MNIEHVTPNFSRRFTARSRTLSVLGELLKGILIAFLGVLLLVALTWAFCLAAARGVNLPD